MKLRLWPVEWTEQEKAGQIEEDKKEGKGSQGKNKNRQVQSWCLWEQLRSQTPLCAVRTPPCDQLGVLQVGRTPPIVGNAGSGSNSGIVVPTGDIAFMSDGQ